MQPDIARRGDVRFAETSLDLEATMPFERWAEVGSLLGRVHRASRFWLGDWLNFGESVYGEKYAQAVDETGLDYSTLATCAWVARQIEPSRRRESLSFAAHREVAALPPAEQDAWLARAERDHLGSRDLRRELRALRAADAEEVIEIRVSRATALAWRRKADTRPLESVVVELLDGWAAPMRESVETKAARYLAERRLLVLQVHDGLIRASCRGDELYELGWNDQDWWCTCPARRRCAHLVALWCVCTAHANGTNTAMPAASANTRPAGYAATPAATDATTTSA